MATGRFALVTGAAGGLGRGIAVGLARAGYRIAFTYRPGGTPPDRTLALVREHDPEVVAIASDATNEPHASDAVRTASLRGPIEILVHVVGPIVVGPFSQMTFVDYRKMVDGNFGSAVLLAQAVLPSMRERGFGRLIFFGMNGSHVALSSLGQSLYAASKAAVTSLARTLAVEEARHGITVNVVQPGDIQNKEADRAAAVHLPGKNPTGHRGSWQDLAEAVVFFAGDAAGFINGQILAVTGGLTEPYEG